MQRRNNQIETMLLFLYCFYYVLKTCFYVVNQTKLQLSFSTLFLFIFFLCCKPNIIANFVFNLNVNVFLRYGSYIVSILFFFLLHTYCGYYVVYMLWSLYSFYIDNQTLSQHSFSTQINMQSTLWRNIASIMWLLRSFNICCLHRFNILTPC